VRPLVLSGTSTDDAVDAVEVSVATGDQREQTASIS
jgi:hypothetical protein